MTTMIVATNTGMINIPNTNQPVESNPSKNNFIINPVRSQEDLDATINLFRVYAESLNLDLSFQSFEEEMSSMPGKYSPDKGGELLLARNALTNEAIGCIALRRLSSHEDVKSIIDDGTYDVLADGNDSNDAAISNNGSSNGIGNHGDDEYNGDKTTPTTPAHKTVEMKRLYTTPESRSLGLGTALVSRALETAKDQGYEEIKLDTLPSMVGAQRLYRNFGFVDIQPYCFNPVEGVRYLGLKLRR